MKSGSELMKLSELAKTLDASFLSGEEQSDIEIFKAGASDFMSDLISHNAVSLKSGSRPVWPIWTDPLVLIKFILSCFKKWRK